MSETSGQYNKDDGTPFNKQKSPSEAIAKMTAKNWIQQKDRVLRNDYETFTTAEMNEIYLFSPERVKTPDMEACISIIRNLPDLIVEYRHGVRLPIASGGKEIAMLNLIRAKYHAIAKWLELYRLDRTYLLIELQRSKAKHYKPLAEIANSRYKLALELFQRNDLVFPCHRVTGQPLELRWWMLLIVGQECEAELNKSGFLTGIASPSSKSKIYETFGQFYRDLPKGVTSQLCESPVLSRLEIASPFSDPFNSLEGLARFIAEIDIDWRNGYYYEYTTKMRRLYRTIERDPRLSVMYLDETGNLKKLGRGKDTRTAKKKIK
jgi:hypothetical protein